MKRFFTLIALSLGILFATSYVFAFTVTINVNGYQGQYKINSSSWLTGNQDLDLSEGTHTFHHNPGSFYFDVDSNGDITSQFTTAATGSGSSLNLKTFDIQIDPQKYDGTYSLTNLSTVSGIQTIKVIIGLEYGIRTGENIPVANFWVNGSENIIPIWLGDNLIISTASIKLKNAYLTVDPGKYEGPYSLRGQTYKGIHRVLLVSGAQYYPIKSPLNTSLLDISVDEDGDISTSPWGGFTNFVAERGKVTFKTVKYEIYPGFYSTPYYINGFDTLPGEQSYDLIPQTFFRITNWTSGDIIGHFKFDEDGDITSTDTTSFNYINGKIFFKNAYVKVTPPMGYGGNYNIYRVSSHVSGISHHYLIQNNFYRIGIPSVGYFNFEMNDCSSNINVSTSEGTFTIECENFPTHKWLNTNEDEFNNINSDVRLQFVQGQYSLDSADYSLTNNGNSISVINDYINEYLFTISNILVNGRNVIVLDGEDSSSSSFQKTTTVWAGNNEVIVETGSPTTNYDVTLTVEQTVGMTTYYHDVTQTTVDGVTIFKNVPTLSAEVTTTIKNNTLRKRFFINQNMKIQL